MIKIQNVYYMLAYAYQVLRENGYAYLSDEEFDGMQNLLASILSKGIANQIKRGLGREYILQNDLLNSPRGKINITDTIKRSPFEKKVSCEFDEFSENSYFNRILKTTANLMTRSQEVDGKIKKSLKRSLLFLENVECMPVAEIRWDILRYNRNNASYKMLLNICYLIINGLLMSQQNGVTKFSNFLDEKHMHDLYERFILEYYRRHYPCLSPVPSKISWRTDDNMIDFLPEMRSDITLKYGDEVLIIDAKYYGKSMQTSMYDKKTVHSGNLYQIFTYVKNKDINNNGKVSGILLYAKTDEEISPDFTYKLSGNTIKVATLDLNLPFAEIASQLDAIACEWNSTVSLAKVY